MLRPKDVLFGEIAVALGFLTRKQLVECIRSQKHGRTHKRLGAMCQDLGYLDARQVDRVLAHQQKLKG